MSKNKSGIYLLDNDSFLKVMKKIEDEYNKEKKEKVLLTTQKTQETYPYEKYKKQRHYNKS